MTKYQITVDCTDPDRMARFWADALRYSVQPPPGEFETWAEYWLSVGVPEDEVGDGYDSIIDPEGTGPRIWFQVVPDRKSVKNRLHFDVLVGGGRSIPLETRQQLVIAEALRLTNLGASQLRIMDNPDIDHFAIAMVDPEGNEFDIV